MMETPSSLASLETIYCVRVAEQYRWIEFLGWPHLKEERPIGIGEIYIPLSFTWERDGKERLSVPAALKESRHLVVLGDPGSGKTTLVRALTYAFGRLEAPPLVRALGKRIPVPIILRDYEVSRWDTPDAMLQDFIARFDAKTQAKLSPEWLREKLRQGEGILLVDGLDEVGSRERRKALCQNVLHPLLSEMGESYAILTSRVVGYEEVPLEETLFPSEEQAEFLLSLRGRDRLGGPGLRRCYVAPFNEEERNDFIQRWYTIRESDERTRAHSIQTLQRAINRTESIQRLATNPFLLTLMALVHRVLGELPSGRANLYDKIVEAYLESIQRYRGLSVFEASLSQMKRWLAHVGWEMQELRTHQAREDREVLGEGEEKSENILVSQETVETWLKEAMEKTGRANAQEEAPRFLDYIARRSGLLIPRGQRDGVEQYAWVHLTFQEYFAAYALFGKVAKFDRMAEDCLQRVTDPRWHETILLLFEMFADMEEAGDDLAKVLRKDKKQDEAKEEWQGEDRQQVARLFAELLLDDQNNLSRGEQKATAEFVLAAYCAEYDHAIQTRLNLLSDEKFEALVQPWVEAQLTKRPADLGDHFFLALPQLNAYQEGWAERMATYVQNAPREEALPQSWDLVLFAGTAPEVLVWGGGGGYLPKSGSLSPTNGFCGRIMPSPTSIPTNCWREGRPPHSTTFWRRWRCFGLSCRI